MKITPGRGRRHYFKGLGIFLIGAVLMAGLAGCPPGPTEIRDWYDLDGVRDDLEEDYVLMNDLDASTPGYAELAGPAANGGKGWYPIGASDISFTGTFNGQGHEIRDLYINRPDQDYVGLIACTSWMRHIENFGIVENVGVVNAQVTGHINVGALVGHNGGIVGNAYSSGTVRGKERVGGLVGWNQRTLLNSYSRCTVSGELAVGGLVGENWQRAAVSDSYSDGIVSGSSKVGGLVGWHYYGSITNCYSSASVNGSVMVGGLAGGSLGGTATNSFWDTAASGIEVSEGGTGKTTAEMTDMRTFTDTATAGLHESWDIRGVAPNTRDHTYTWNIVDGQTHPFLSWQLTP